MSDCVGWVTGDELTQNVGWHTHHLDGQRQRSLDAFHTAHDQLCRDAVHILVNNGKMRHAAHAEANGACVSWTATFPNLADNTHLVQDKRRVLHGLVTQGHIDQHERVLHGGYRKRQDLGVVAYQLL